MRVARIVFALPGLAALVWGLVLTVQFALHSFRDGRSAVVYLIGGPIVHDGLVAPVVGLAGLLIGRWVGPHWRAPVRIGAAISAVLAVIAVPALWRTYAGQPNPGLDDRNYLAGLLIALAVVWLAVGAGGLLRRHHTRLHLRRRNKKPTKPVSSPTPAVRPGSQ